MSEVEKTSQERIKICIKNILHNIFIGITSKIITLIFTVLLLRIVSKEDYGTAKVTFDFIFHFVLFLPRHTLRKVARKYSPDKKEEKQEDFYYECSKLNSIIITLTFILMGTLLFVGSKISDHIEDNKIHYFIYIISAIIELLVEPIIIYGNMKFLTNNKIYAMTISNYTKIISNYIFTLVFELELLSFSLSRLIGSSFYFIFLTYLGYFQYKIKISYLFPSFAYMKQISNRLFSNYVSYSKNNFIKFIFTHIEHFILAFYVNFSEVLKAEYSFVIDTFSLILRFILEPIEENFNNLISYEHSKNTKTVPLLQKTIKFMMIIATLLVFYIYIIGKDLIKLIYTEKWSNNEIFLIVSYYSVFLGLTFISTILDSYAHVTLSDVSMKSFRRSLMLTTLLSGILTIYFTRINISGFIIANIISSIINIFISLFYILEVKLSFQGFIKSCVFLYNCRFSLSTFLSILISVYFLNIFKDLEQLQFLSIGGVTFIVNTVSIYLLEIYSI